MEKMHVSCGALAYTYDNEGRLGIVLGREKGNWLPFKGCIKEGETDVQTASRELYEETCGLVYVDAKKIKLLHIFETKRKEYRIALVYMPFSKIEEFRLLRSIEDRHDYLEKDMLQFFPFDNSILSSDIHNITKASIQYYWNTLLHLKNCKHELVGRKHAVSHQYACEHCTQQYIDKVIKNNKEALENGGCDSDTTICINESYDNTKKPIEFIKDVSKDVRDTTKDCNKSNSKLDLKPRSSKNSNTYLKNKKPVFLKRPRYYGLTSVTQNNKQRDLQSAWRKEIDKS